MDGLTDRQMDGWTDGWMDGWSDRMTDRQTDGWTDGQTDGQMDGHMDRQMNGWMKTLIWGGWVITFLKFKYIVLDTIPILNVWPVLVRYRFWVVGILVGIYYTVSFKEDLVLTIGRELHF